VVDDEPDARDLIARLLRSRGAEVMTADCAAQAFELLRQTRPHVLLSDIGMPEEDGYALIRRVRELPADRGGRTPAAALTAFARAEDRLQALNSGFDTHLAKPVEEPELAAVVAELARGPRADSPETVDQPPPFVEQANAAEGESPAPL
jgi:CheY-like chemotaxis protein